MQDYGVHKIVTQEDRRKLFSLLQVPKPHTLSPNPHTLNPNPHTVHPKPWTLNPGP